MNIKHVVLNAGHPYKPLKFDRDGRGGQRRSKYGPEMTRIRLQSPPKASKWVNMSANGSKAPQTIRGNCGDHLGSIYQRLLSVFLCAILCVY